MWKLRARDGEFKLKVWQEALDSLGHEAANGVNALRANLLSYRQGNGNVQGAEHLEEIAAAARRIDSAIRRSRDPMAWKKARQKSKQQTQSALAADSRSRIAM